MNGSSTRLAQTSYTYGNGITITGSTFTSNTASEILLLHHPYTSIKNSTFDGNKDVFVIDGGTLDLDTVDFGKTTINSGDSIKQSGGTVNINGPVYIGDKFTVTAGTFNINTDKTLTLAGTGNVTGGTFNNAGTLTINSDGKLNVGSITMGGSGTISNSGTVHVNDEATFSFGENTLSGGTLDVAGTLNMGSDVYTIDKYKDAARLADDNNKIKDNVKLTGAGKIKSENNVILTGTGTEVTVVPTAIETNATISVTGNVQADKSLKADSITVSQDVKLTANNSLNATNKLTINSNATLTANATDSSLTAVTLENNGTADIKKATVTNLNNAGTIGLTGTNTITTVAGVSGTNGTFKVNGGTTDVTGSYTQSTTSVTGSGSMLNLKGTQSDSAGTLTVGDGASLTTEEAKTELTATSLKNSGTVTLNHKASVTGAVTNDSNKGKFVVNAGSGNSVTVSGTYTQNETDVNSGTLALNGTTSNVGGLTVSTNGKLTNAATDTLTAASIANTGTVELSGTTDVNGAVTGDTGIFNVEGNTTTVTGAFTQNDVTIATGNNAKLVLNGATEIKNLLTNNGEVDINAAGTLITVSGNGKLVANAGSGNSVTVSGAYTQNETDVNSGTLNLSGSVSDSLGIVTVVGGATLINTESTTLVATSLDNTGTVTLDSGDSVSGNVVNNNGGVLTATLAKLATSSGSVTNNGTFYMEGNLTKDIAGNGSGKTVLNSDTVYVSGNRTISGELNLNSKTVNMQETAGTTAEYNTLTVNKLTGTGNLNIDVALGGGNNTDTSKIKSDLINITSTGSTATLNLNSINVRENGLAWGNNTDAVTYVTGNTSGITYNVNGSSDGKIVSQLDTTGVSVSTTSAKYTFTKGTTAGKLNVWKDSAVTLQEFVEGTAEAAKNVTSYTIDRNYDVTSETTGAGTTWAAGGETLGTDGSRNTVTLNINSNIELSGNKNVGGTKPDGINVNSGYSLTVNGATGANITNFATALKNNGGTLSVSDVTMSNNTTDISNSGTLTLSGTNNLADALLNAGTVNLTGSNTIATVSGVGTTNGTFNVNGGITNVSGSYTQSTTSITGSGSTLNLKGSQSDSAGTLTVGEGASLTTEEAKTELTATSLKNSGTVTLNHKASVTGAVTNDSNKGKFVANAGSGNSVTVSGAYTQNETVVYGGTLALNGNLVNVGALTVAIEGKLTNAATDTLTAASIANTGTVELSGTTNVSGAVTGDTGTFNVDGNTTTVTGAFTQNDVTIAAGNNAKLVLNGATEIKNLLTNDGEVDINAAGTLKTVSGNGKLVANAGANKSITVSDSYVQTTTEVDSGTLALNGTTANVGALTVAIEGKLTNAATDSLTAASIANTGTVELSGTTNVSGAVTGDTGTFKVDGNTTTVTDAFTQNDVTVAAVNNAKLVLNGATEIKNLLTNDGEVDINAAGTLITVSGNGKLVVASTDKSVTVSGAYTQNVTDVTSGTLSISGAATSTTTNVTGGTLSLSGSVSDSLGTVTVGSGASLTNTESTTLVATSLDNTGTVTLDSGDSVTGSVVNNNGGVLTATLAKLATSSGSVTNNGTFNMEGNLTKDIAGTGTTVLQSDTVYVSGDRTISGELNLNSKTVNMQESAGTTAEYKVLTVNKLTGTGNLNIDVDLSATGIQNDKIVVNGTGSSATINLSNIVVRSSTDGLNWGKNADAVTYVDASNTGSLTGITTTVNGTTAKLVKYPAGYTPGVASSTTQAKYTFTASSTTGKLNVLKDSAITLKEFVEGVADGAKNVYSYTIDRDYDVATETAAAGTTWTATGETLYSDGTNRTKAVTLAINEGKVLSGDKNNTNKPAGIIVNDVYTLNVTGATGAKITNFGTALNNNGGTLNVSDISMSSNTTDISNSGTLTFTGTNTLSDEVSNSGTIYVGSNTDSTTSTTTIHSLTQSAGSTTVKSGSELLADTITLTGGSLSNSGTLTMNDTNDKLDLQSGSFTNNNSATISNIASAGTLTNSGALTATTIDVTAGSLTNDATKTISINDNGHLNVSDASEFNNAGTIAPASGATNTSANITSAGSLTNSGTISLKTITVNTTGTLDNTNGTMGAGTGEADSQVNLANGQIKGGTVQAVTVSQAAGTLGDSTNTKVLAGTFTQTAGTANLAADTNITTATTNGTVNVNDAATITTWNENAGAGNVKADSTITTWNVGDAVGDANTAVATIAGGVTLTADVVTVNSDGKLTNSGTMTMNDASDKLDVKAGGTFINNATANITNITNDGTLTNTGSINANVTNDGTLTNTGSITGSVTNNSTGTLTTDASKITLGTGDGFTNNGTLNFTGGTNSNVITGSTGTLNIGDGSATVAVTNNATITQNAVNIKDNATLTSSADNVKASVTNDGTYNVTGGTIASAIGATNARAESNNKLNINGDTTLGAKVTQQNITVADGKTLTANSSTSYLDATDNLTLESGSTLNMKSTTTPATYNTLTVGTLTANDAKLRFDLEVKSGTGADVVQADKIVANTATGTLTLDSVNVTADLGETPAVGTPLSFTLVDSANDSGLTINGTITATSSGYKYEFKQDTSDKGKLTATKGYSGTLADIIQNHKDSQEYELGKIATYSLVDNYTTTDNLGTLTRVATNTPRTFTINGNNHILSTTAANKGGITVNSGDTLSLKDITVSGFATAVTNNNGATVNVNGVTFTGTTGTADITNNGTLNVNGSLTLDKGISGTGTTNFNVDFTNTKTLTNNVTVAVSKTLTNNGSINGDVTNSGTLENNGTLSGKVTNSGTMTTAAEKITGGVENNSALTLTGGELASDISGNGTTTVDGVVTFGTGKTVGNAVTINAGKSLTNSGTLNGAVSITAEGTSLGSVTNSGTISGAVTNQGTLTNTGTLSGKVTNSGTMETTANGITGGVENNNTLTLTGGALASAISSGDGNTGTLNINADVSLEASVTKQNINVAENTTLTANSSTSYLDATDNLTLESGSTLKMKSTTTPATYNTLTMGTLTANDAKLSFDLEIKSGTGADVVQADKIVANTATGTLTLDSVNVTADLGETPAVGTPLSFTLVESADDNGLTISGTTTATSNGYKYVFEQDATDKGKLTATKGYTGTFTQIIQNATVEGYALANIATYSLVGDYATAENLGVLTRVDTNTPRTFTINGNKHTLSTSAADKGGITVNSGDTLNLKDITVSGFATVVTNNSGAIVNVDGVTFTGTTGTADIVNDGTLNVNGSLTLDKGISGTGTTNFNADFTNTKTLTNNVTVAVSKTLTNNGSITGDVTNSGTLTNTAGKNISGSVTNNSDATLNASLADIATASGKTVTNNGTFNMSGNLSKDIAGTGTTVLQNDIALTDADADHTVEGTLNANGKTINMQESSTSVKYGTLAAGTLAGKGTLSIDADLVNNTSDKLTIGAAAKGAQVDLKSILVRNDSTDKTGSITYVDGDGAGSLTYLLNGTESGQVVSATSNYNYIFTLDADHKGQVVYTRDTQEAVPQNVSEFISGKSGTKDIIATNYVMQEDETLQNSLTTATNDKRTSKELTLGINANVTLSGTGSDGITVAQDFTLNINSAENAKITNMGIALTNNGTLNVSDVTLSGNGTDVVNNGTASLSSVVVDTVNNSGTVTLSNVSAKTISNEGGLTLAGTNAIDKISGTGTAEVVTGTTTVNGDFAQSLLTVDEAATYSQVGGSFEVAEAVANAGTINFNSVDLAKDTTTGDTALKFSCAGTINLNNSKLYANQTALSTILGSNKLSLNDGSFIYTTTNQIYNTAAGAGVKQTGGVSQTNITYNAGTLVFSDEKFTRDYVNDALAELQTATSGSTTKVVMTGTLDGTYRTDDAEKDTKAGVIYDNATVVNTIKKGVEQTYNLLVGSTTEEIAKRYNITDKHNQNINAAKLQLETNAEDGQVNIVIDNAKDLCLGGSTGAAALILNTDNNPATNVNITVGEKDSNDNDTKGTLTIGNELATTTTKYNLNSSVTLQNGSTLKNNSDTTISGDVTLNEGTIEAGEGNLKVTTLITKGTETGEAKVNTVTGKLDVTNLQSNANSVLNLGTTGANGQAAKVTITNAELQGGTLFLDPAWKDGVGLEGASKAAVKSTTLDGNYVVGQNSLLSFGTDNTDDADKMFKEAAEACNLIWGETGTNNITAAAYLGSNIDLSASNSALYVDGTKTTAPTSVPNKLNFAANSLLMVNASNITNTAAITIADSDKVAITSGATLYVDNAEEYKTYKIISVAGGEYSNGEENSFWKNILTSTDLIKLERYGNSGNVITKLANPSAMYNLLAPNAVDATNVSGTDAQKSFLKNATSTTGYTHAQRQDNLNSLTGMTELGGVERNLYTANDLFTDAVAEHISLAKPLEHDHDVWAKYIHSKEQVDGLGIGSAMGAEYDSQYNGIVAGVDLYHQGKGTVGVAVTYMNGNTIGGTLAADTKNESKYYGMSVYGAIQNKNTAVLGDVSYLHSSNDLKQNNSGMDITGSAKADTFSVGVKAEAAFQAGDGKFVPYVGLRFLHLGVGDYSNSLGMNYNTDAKNMTILPFGLKYSVAKKLGQSTFRTNAEVGYVLNLSSNDGSQNISWNGGNDSYSFDLTDRSTFNCKLGFELENGNMTYGLGYEFQKSSSTLANRFTANLNWRF